MPSPPSQSSQLSNPSPGAEDERSAYPSADTIYIHTYIHTYRHPIKGPYPKSTHTCLYLSSLHDSWMAAWDSSSGLSPLLSSLWKGWVSPVRRTQPFCDAFIVVYSESAIDATGLGYALPSPFLSLHACIHRPSMIAGWLCGILSLLSLWKRWYRRWNPHGESNPATSSSALNNPQ